MQKMLQYYVLVSGKYVKKICFYNVLRLRTDLKECYFIYGRNLFKNQMHEMYQN